MRALRAASFQGTGSGGRTSVSAAHNDFAQRNAGMGKRRRERCAPVAEADDGDV